MASNYGDLSRQLELGVSTFFLFFFQITELEKTEGEGASNAHFPVEGDVGNSWESFGSTPKRKYSRLTVLVLSSEAAAPSR